MMFNNKYGTWSTFDAPTDNIDRAEEFLREELEKIGGNVRRLRNSHDFGSYPSFEIDKPVKFEQVDYEYHECSCGTCKECRDYEEFDAWITKVNELESKYCDKFKMYL